MAVNRFRVDLKATAFFVCDIQERFKPHIFEFDNLVHTAAKMVRVAKELQIPVVVTEQNPQGLGRTVQDIDVSNAVINAPKSKFSMVIPDVKVYIQSHGIKTVVLFGLEAHVCVYQTSLDLLSDNVNVIVLADGCSSINKGEIGIALEGLRTAGCVVASSESVVFQLLNDASHPKFKAVQGIVKEYKDVTKSAIDTLGAQSKANI